MSSLTTIENISSLLQQGKGIGEISRILGVAKSTVSYHAKRLGYGTPRTPPKDWDEIQSYYDQGHSIRECCKKFHFCMRSLQKAIQKGKFVSRKRSKSDINIYLTNDRPQTARSHLKRKLIEQNLLKEICAICNMEPIWNGKKLILHLDHINGHPKDNRLENLRLLCPNCHSQTETYAGKKTKSCVKQYKNKSA